METSNSTWAVRGGREHEASPWPPGPCSLLSPSGQLPLPPEPHDWLPSSVGTPARLGPHLVVLGRYISFHYFITSYYKLSGLKQHHL
jgi:hypothetical protein